MFLIDDYVVFVVVVAALAFVVDVSAAEFDAVISVDVAVVLVLFVVAAVASDFQIDDADFAVAWYFFRNIC